MDRETLIARMHGFNWYHKIELAPGIVTPGHDWESLWDPMRRYHRSVSFRDKRVLEIGCWDGYWSFEAETLGAREVWATDDMTQRRNRTETVPFVIECRGSRVRYRDDVSVYDVDRAFDDPFDIVIFYGVLYHLRYPVLGVSKLRRVLRRGGLLLLETASLLDTEDSVMRFGQRNVYAEDRSTWNAPSLSCLRVMLESSYFSVDVCETYLRQDDVRKIGRTYVKATAVQPLDDQWHIVPDYVLKDVPR